MHIYALRHGESEYNIRGLCNDDPARGVRLTATGRRQAEQAAWELRRVPLDCIFSSELPRARETAAIVARPHTLVVQPRSELNDIRTGCDGRPVTEYFQRIAQDRMRTRVGDGETLLEHKQRIMAFLDWLHTQRECRCVLLVAHEETLRVCAARAGNLGDSQMLALGFANCETLEFEL